MVNKIEGDFWLNIEIPNKDGELRIYPDPQAEANENWTRSTQNSDTPCISFLLVRKELYVVGMR